MKTFIIVLLLIPFLQAQELTVGIGVMHKEESLVSRLKTFDRAREGDEIRIFVKPKNDCFIYVISYNEEQAYLLNPETGTQSISADNLLILPTDEDFYVFEAEDETTTISVLCSIEPLPSITMLFDEEAFTEAGVWEETEALLFERAKTDLSEEPDKPLSMAGNVRVINNNFENKLQYFTDDDLILKRYIIAVK